MVAYPIGDEFAYDPVECGLATSLDFAFDVLAELIFGASHVDVTLAVLQGDFYVAEPSPSTPRVGVAEGNWTRLSHEGLAESDFLAVWERRHARLF